uniref:STAS domain-containing protein n=1 Tax=Kalanchoe fedtschenkoi TaxID=63787 RepID=A0A7N0ZTU7_KALFE
MTSSNDAHNIGRSTSCNPSNNNHNVDDSRINMDSRQSQVEVHHVRLPPDVSTLQKLKNKLSEIFFPDDPFFRVKNHSFGGKLLFGFQYFIPVLKWLPKYKFKMFRSDLISGITIASLAIPQGISYAKLAGLPPIIGLYSSFVPPLIYAVLGSSRHLGVGPVSIASLVMGTMLSESISPINEQELYLKLAFSATFFAGMLQAALGLFRLGFLIDFLSKPTLVGFMAGAAIIVSMQQLKGLLGIVHFTPKMQVVPVMSSVFGHTKESARRPKLFWISAAAPLTSVIISTTLVYFLKSKMTQVKYIGKLPKGINPSSKNLLIFRGPHLSLAIKTGIITGILSLTEGIAVGRTFASMENYQIDGNKEMLAIGIMNLCGSCASCYVTTGAFSRSALNFVSGAKSAISNVVMAVTVLVTLLFLMPLFYYTPNAILSSIIIVAVISLVDIGAAIHLWKTDKIDFIAFLCAFFGVLFISVPVGLAVSVGVSVLRILLNATRPNTTQLGKLPGTQIYQCFARYEQALRLPSFLIIGIESPIYFTNATYMLERMLRWVREEDERIESLNNPPLRCVILDLSAVTAIDASGIDALCELKRVLDRKSLQLVLVNPPGAVVEKLHKSKTLESFMLSGLYLTVGEAIADISSTWKM